MQLSESDTSIGRRLTVTQDDTTVNGSYICFLYDWMQEDWHAKLTGRESEYVLVRSEYVLVVRSIRAVELRYGIAGILLRARGL